MNKKLIAQLAAGEVILENDLRTTKGEAKVSEIISKAFGDTQLASGESGFYFKSDIQYRGWSGSEARLNYHMPSCAKYVKASEFLKEDEEEFVWGEEVKHKNGSTYYYIGSHPFRKNEVIVCNEHGGIYNLSKKSLSKLPPIKEVTLKEVAEKFGVSVEQIRIKE